RPALPRPPLVPSTTPFRSGDPGQPPPPPERKSGRNSSWRHLHSRDVVSMPDTWEYPWWAAWDLGFHMLVFAKTDPEFAKEQLLRSEEHTSELQSRSDLVCR